MKKIVFSFIVFFLLLPTLVHATDYDTEFLMRVPHKSLRCNQLNCKILDMSNGPTIIFGWALSSSASTTAPGPLSNTAKLEVLDAGGNEVLTLAHSDGPSVYNWGLPVDMSSVTSSPSPWTINIKNSNISNGQHGDAIIYYFVDGQIQGFGSNAREWYYQNATSSVELRQQQNNTSIMVILTIIIVTLLGLDFLRRIAMPRKL